MTKVSINGIEFNAADGEPADFGCFTEGHEKATDAAPWGMLAEMKTFIRLQDELHLRNLVDAGALFGVFSLVFTRYPDATAWAFDASPWAWDGLRDNVNLNPDRKINPAQVFVGENCETIACGREWRHITANRHLDSVDVMECDAIALDNLHFRNRVDCLKIDVEGYEGPVLRGARKLIARDKPIIFLEAHFSVLKEASGDTRETLMNFFKEVGYEVKTLQGEPVYSFPDALPSRFVCWPKV